MCQRLVSVLPAEFKFRWLLNGMMLQYVCYTVSHNGQVTVPLNTGHITVDLTHEGREVFHENVSVFVFPLHFYVYNWP